LHSILVNGVLLMVVRSLTTLDFTQATNRGGGGAERFRGFWNTNNFCKWPN